MTRGTKMSPVMPSLLAAVVVAVVVYALAGDELGETGALIAGLIVVGVCLVPVAVFRHVQDRRRSRRRRAEFERLLRGRRDHSA